MLRIRLARSLTLSTAATPVLARHNFDPHGRQANTFRAPAPAAETAALSKRLRVLVAEDNNVNRIVIRKILERMGHSVHIAHDGKQSLAAFNDAEFDLVLMDMQMPNMDGIEASKRIRSGEAGERGREVPIYALTAAAFEADRQRCLEAGMNLVLTKPIDVQALTKVLQAV